MYEEEKKESDVWHEDYAHNAIVGRKRQEKKTVEGQQWCLTYLSELDSGAWAFRDPHHLKLQ